MIGSGTIGSYGSHEHTVTKCLHETHGVMDQRIGPVSGGPGTAGAKPAKTVQNTFTLTDMLSDGWKGFFSKAYGIWGRVWGNGPEGHIRGGESERAVLAEGQSAVKAAAAVTQQPVAGYVPQDALAAAVSADAAARKTQEDRADIGAAVKAQEHAAGKIAAAEDSGGQGRAAGKGTNGTESKGEGMSGGMRDDMGKARDGKSRKYVKQLFRGFGKSVTGRIFRGKEESEKGEEDILPEGGVTGLGTGESSYLLDSYNRSGEYSTLAKDRSLEGSFRAAG